MINVFLFFCRFDCWIEQKQEVDFHCPSLVTLANLDSDEKCERSEEKVEKDDTILPRHCTRQFAEKIFSYTDFSLLFRSLIKTVVFVGNRAVFHKDVSSGHSVHCTLPLTPFLCRCV